MFPVLRLPHLAFKSVYRHLEIPDVIMLSQCSKRMKTIVRFMEKNGGKTLEVSIENLYSFMEVLSKKKKRLFIWKICLEGSRCHDEETFANRIIEEKSWIIAEGRCLFAPNWLSVSRWDCIDQDTLLAVRIFQNVFQCSIGKIETGFVKNIRFDKLLRSTSILHSARKISIKMPNISPAQMTFTLDTFVAEKLSIAGYAGWQYSYQKPVLRFPNIKIKFEQWITAPYLMEMAETCKKIRLWDGTRITDQDLNRLIKTWLAGTNETLEKIKICRHPDFGVHRARPPSVSFKRDVILNDVKFTERKNRPEAESDEENDDDDEKIEVEIKRGDGKLARVIVHQERNFDYGQFQFIVVKESC